MKIAKTNALITLTDNALDTMRVLGTPVQLRNLWIDTREILGEVKAELRVGHFKQAKAGLAKASNTLLTLEASKPVLESREVTLESRATVAANELSTAYAIAIRLEINKLHQSF